MNDVFYGELSVIGMRGCEKFVAQVDAYLKEARQTTNTTIVVPEWIRFGNGEGKCVLHDSMRGHDVYIIADLFNYGVKYKMYGIENHMSPDDHFQDLKRIIGAIAGKARRLSVIMPMLYESRQDKRAVRESLDCAVSLQELVTMGVSNIITFDVHNSCVQNSIPLSGFDNVQPSYQMIKALIREVPDIEFDSSKLMFISPDEGGMQRCMYYSSVLGIELGMFYKRRDYTVVKDGRNPIVAHRYLGKPVRGKDVIIIDDMISSGDSMFDIAKQLKDKGANRIFMFATFGLFCNGLQRFDDAYEKGLINRIFTTNLIYRTPQLLTKEWYVEVNMCKYVAYIIETLNHDNTISKLLNPVDRIHTYIDNWEREKNKKNV
jgi:ribose-phosphate pyrophosphokinase